MVQPIVATYRQDDEDWSITVAGLGKELTARAPGIIAARDRADQLVEKLAPEGTATTVVHLLNGSALEFTAAYMSARLARTTAEPAPAPAAAPTAPNPTVVVRETKSTKPTVPTKELSRTPEEAGKAPAQATPTTRMPGTAAAAR
ncbi:hypothetical protein SAMN05421810_10282 [Amycolatopsis arida]|uniref:Uncharacterized protein n=1 Tax=Amycolatopsis arida TaxID=587909 RepID=A0A1I5NYT3_9PSEU|nr:hypothetical protein [Amycolatopsis arida]TDX98291.1 hypothetical protein CLV69_10182 [Amycolatopsis arida]SFP26964.1 hypothetical protein SAMN05421810_10282 [Amycolatopsis arida]